MSSNIKPKNKGVKFPCNQCDYRATQRHHFLTHIKSKHEGVRSCNQCDYITSEKRYLVKHIAVRQTGVNYACNQASQGNKKGKLIETC